MSQKKPHYQQPAVPTAAEVASVRNARRDNRRVMADVIQDYTDLECAQQRLEEQVAWMLRDIDVHNCLNQLARTWSEQTASDEVPQLQPLSTQVLGGDYTPDAAATADLPQPLKVIKVALMGYDRATYYVRGRIEDYVLACLADFTEYCEQVGEQSVCFSDLDDINAVLFLALAAQYLELNRKRRSFNDEATVVWLDACFAYGDNQPFGGCYRYMVCANLLHALGDTARAQDTEFSLRIKMQLIYVLFCSALEDSDCIQLFLDPRSRGPFKKWLQLFALCWQCLPADTRQRLLVDDDTECQFSTIELCATVAEEKAAKVAAVQYRCGDTGEA